MCLFYISVYLRAVRGGYWLDKKIIFVLMLCYLTSEGCKDCFIEALGLAVCLWMRLCSRCMVYSG